MIGNTLAHYQITAKLGAGGMGEVYRATDAKLGRDVAIKILPPALANDPERVARFQREARTLASIQHPNIASIYGFEEADGHRFLVMELVDGDDLSVRLQKGALGVSESLDIARQIAVGLEAAHAKGIVHRDLKPANVKIGPGGQVKILDFGLARAVADEPEQQDLEHSPTITAAMTQHGVILGTAAYMSPEQARGKVVDRRTDLWALGCVLYEMLTGDRFFEGETLPDSIGAILHKEPDFRQLPPRTPATIRLLLQRCLAKDPQKRLRDAGDARLELEQALADPSDSALGLDVVVPDAPARGGIAPWWIAVGLLLGLGLGVGIATLLRPAPPAPAVRKLDLGIDLVAPSTDQITAALSPDGLAVAFTHEGKLWVQPLDQADPRPLDGTDGAMDPFWSPDASEIGYFTQEGLWRVALRGGRPVQLCGFEDGLVGGHGADWGEDDRIVFSQGNSGILAVSGRGGQPHEIVPVGEDEGDLHEPSLLPQGRGVLFPAHPKDGSAYELWLFADGQRRLIFASAQPQEYVSDPRYDTSGTIVFERRSGTATEGVWALPFSLSSLKVTGEPFLVAANGRQPRLGGDGSLAFITGLSVGSGSQQLAWFNRSGRQIEEIGGSRNAVDATDVSPDGSKLVISQWDSESRHMDLWIIDLVRGSEMRLTNDESVEFAPRFLPDGERVSFGRFRPGMHASDLNAYTLPIDGTGNAEVILAHGVVSDISRDGSYFLTTLADPADTTMLSPQTTEFTVGAVRADGSEPPHHMTRPGANFSGPLSPDGRWALFSTGRSTAEEIFLTRFPDGGRRWQVTIEGGNSPLWDPRGDRIYFVAQGALQEVSFDVADGEPRLGTPTALFDVPAIRTGSGSPQGIAISPDGDRFLLLDHFQRDQAQKPRIKLVQNWIAEFR